MPVNPYLTRRGALCGLAVSAMAADMPRWAIAGQWPDRPLKFVVPWPAGGLTDVFARALAREVSPLVGQPVVIDNRSGATGTVGVQYVARGAADGYTLLVPNTTAFIGSVVALGDVVQFDPLRDFTPVGLFVESSSVLWAHPALEADSFEALLARARGIARPRLAFGTTGSGSVPEQAVEQIARHYRLDLLKVPYRGTAPQLVDLIADHVQIGASDYATAGGHYREGRLKPLLVIGRNRMAELPGTPTTAELCLSEPDFTVWKGIFAPAATPAPVVARLRQAVEAALASEGFRAVADGNGNRAIFQTGEAVTQRLANELRARRAFALLSADPAS